MMKLSRTAILGLLIALSIIFAILLTFVVLKLWKYLQRKRKEDGLLSNEDNTLDEFPSGVIEEQETCPIDWTKVTVQKPIEDNQVYLPPVPTTHPTRKITVYEIPEEEEIGPIMMRHGESLLSIECDENFLQTSGQEIPTYKQRSRQRLPSKRKSRREISLRGASISEDMFIESLHKSFGKHSRRCDGESVEKINANVTEIPYVVPPSNRVSHILDALQPKGGICNTNHAGAQQGCMFKKGGKIVFKTTYIEQKNELEVDIIKAFDIASARDMLDITPFVRVCLLPGKKQKQDTKHKKQPTKEPFFNEKIIFEGITKGELESLKLNLRVCNHTHGITKKKEVLGEAEIALSSIDLDKEKSFSVTLFQKKCKVSSGTISLSVCHEATMQKLVAIIHEVQLPRAPKSVMKSNQLATVTLCKGDVPMMKKETESKRITEERLEFDVHTTTAEGLGMYSLDLMLRHNTYVGKGNTIGRIRLTLSSSQKSAEEQWKSVIEVPHSYHRAVHAFIDPDDL